MANFAHMGRSASATLLLRALLGRARFSSTGGALPSLPDGLPPKSLPSAASTLETPAVKTRSSRTRKASASVASTSASTASTSASSTSAAGDTTPPPAYTNSLVESLKHLNSRVDRIPHEDNTVNLLDAQSFPYGIAEADLREWLRIAANIISTADKRPIRSGSGLSPTLLLSYTQEDGELMLRKLAMGIAKSLGADFVAISLESARNMSYELMFADPRRHPADTTDSTAASLPASTLPGGEGEQQQRQPLSPLSAALAELLSNPRTRRAKDLQETFRGSTFSLVLHYLESLSVANPSGSPTRGAASAPTPPPRRQVIYIHNEEGIIMEGERFYGDYRKYLRHRRSDTETLFIINEGCGRDPDNIPRSHAMSFNRYRPPAPRGFDPDGEEEEEFEVEEADSGEESAFTRLDSIMRRHSYGSHILSPPNDRTRSHGMDDLRWLVDHSLGAPRILVSPPLISVQGRPATLLHRRQIGQDSELLMLRRNCHTILRQLRPLASRKSSSLAPYWAVLSTQLVDNPQLLDPIPALKRFGLGPAEVLMLCLTLPSHFGKHSPPHEIMAAFIEGARDFCQNRMPIASQLGLVGSSPERTEHPLVKLRQEGGGLTAHEERFAAAVVAPGQLRTSFDEIGALEGAKETLHELISLRFEEPEYFSKGILKDSVSGILLFGPPGTGKTLLSKAVAARSGANFIAVSSSTIFDKYVGEGEKNVRGLFSLARKLSPCVVFVDEVDALLDSRDNSFGRPSRLEIVNEFMSEWDGLLSKNEGVTVLAATNRPYVLDDAVLRRLPRRILIDLPDAAARRRILEILLREERLAADLDLLKLGEQCESYSGSDLKNLCIAAAMRALRRHREQPEQPMEITGDDFTHALGDVPPSISEQMGTLHELRQWNRRFGAGEHARRPSRDGALGF